jgi:hypothetical protein
MNRFALEDSFPLHPDTFVFAGRIVEGQAKAGMVFEVPEAGHRWRVIVKAVEFVRKRGGDELLGLLVQNTHYLPGLGVGYVAELHATDT